MISGDLSAELGPRNPFLSRPAALIGLEHEYRLSRHGRPVDFRDLINRLPVPGKRLDPGDAYAYRLESGLALTCDDAEAEIATPPLQLVPDFTDELIAWAAEGHRQLIALLPPDIDCVGYSTHLSVSLATERQPEVQERFARSFGAVLMLLFDRPDGFGIYIRPRPGRLELCGDYFCGPELGAAAVLFAGGIRACLDTSVSTNSAALPPALDINLKPATGRYGLYLGRQTAFGFDLYATGRNARLPLVAAADSVTAQDQLAAALLSARAHLSNDASDTDLENLEAIVSGHRPLPTEVDPSREPLAQPPVASPLFGSAILKPIRRTTFTLQAVAATWDFTILRISGSRRAYACISRDDLASFMDRASAGDLDTPIERFLSTPSSERRLEAHEETRSSALWDELGTTRQLLAPEPDPRTGRYESANSLDTDRTAKLGDRASKPAVRPGKVLLAPASPMPLPVPARPSETESPAPRPRPAPIRPILIGVAAAVIGLIIITAVAAVAGAFDSDSPAVATPTATPTIVASLTPTPSTSVTRTPTPVAAPVIVTPPPPTPTRTAAPTEVPPTATLAPAPSLTPTPRLPCDPPGALQGCTPTPALPSVTPTRPVTPAAPTATPCIPTAGLACPTPRLTAIP